MVPAEGGLLDGIKAHLNSASRGQASRYTALMLMWMGKNWAFLGKQFPCLHWRTWIDCSSGDLDVPVVLFVI